MKDKEVSGGGHISSSMT